MNAVSAPVIETVIQADIDSVTDRPEMDRSPVTTPSLASARALPSRSAARPSTPEDHAVHAPRATRPSGPRDGRGNGQVCFAELRAALEEGWEIVQPIFARPLWSVTDDSATAFNFVLRRERATRLVTVPEGRVVARFIREHHLAVDYRH